MTVSNDDIAATLRAELAKTSKKAQEMELELHQLQERVVADRNWLSAHGYALNGSQSLPTQAQTKIGEPETHVSDVDTKTVWQVVADILRPHTSPMPLAMLSKHVRAIKPSTHRNSIDVAVKKHPDVFEWKKVGKNVMVSLKR